MITTDFYELLLQHQNLNHFFDGVFASDKVPKKIKPSHFIVLNTEPSGSIGQHWYAIYRHDRFIIECFDSLGIDEGKKTFLRENFRAHSTKELLFNTSRVQDLSTSTCGEFVLYFLFQRMHNQDLDYKHYSMKFFLPIQLLTNKKLKSILRT